MNPRTLFTKYLGWCPGVESAAKWVPDRDLSNRNLFLFTVITIGSIIGFPLYFYYVSGQPSYSWGINFTGAPLDNVSGMYVVQKQLDIKSKDSIYNLTIWADMTPGKGVMIQVIRPGAPSSWDTLLQTWTINEDGLIQGTPDKFGTRYSDEWAFWFGSTTWRVSSSSRDQVVHIRIQDMEK